MWLINFLAAQINNIRQFDRLWSTYSPIKNTRAEASAWLLEIGCSFLEQLALEDSTVAIRIDSAEPAIASCIWFELNTGHCQALQTLSWDLSGMVGANVDVKTSAYCPSEELQSRVRPVLRCWAEGCSRLKGGGFSRLISAGRAGYRRDVMESGVSVTNAF